MGIRQRRPSAVGFDVEHRRLARNAQRRPWSRSLAGVGAAGEHGRLRRLRRQLRQQGRHRRTGAAGSGRLYASLVDHAAADQSEQHADHPGAGHQESEPRRRQRGRGRAPSRGGAPGDRQDEESSMSLCAAASACATAGRVWIRARVSRRPSTTQADGGSRRRSREGGFTLTEMMVSTAIMVGITGAVFHVMNPSQVTFHAQPEVADMQQRMRVAVDSLTKELVMAGAGTYTGASAGALYNYFAPVMPYRMGTVDSDIDAEIYYRPDTISIMYVPITPAQTTIST